MELITVIMPFFKKKEYFKDTYTSVINQTYQNLEVIIIYDDYDKKDLDFINDIVKDDKRVKVFSNHSNLGAGMSRNEGIKISKGLYIAFVDCDDIWNENKIEYQYNFMKKNNSKFSHTSYEIINSSNISIGLNIAKKNLEYNDLINSCDIGLSTVMIKKELFNISNFKNINTKEDYALWLELSRNNIKIDGINKTLAKWRKTENSLSNSYYYKFVNAFKVYYLYEKKNILISVFLVINLGLNYLKKKIKQKKNL